MFQIPYTTLVTGTTITASWANASVRDQVITPFASTSARDSAISTPLAGMMCYTSDTDTYFHYNGAKWMRQSKTVQVGSLQTYSGTGFVDIPNMTFAADAGGVYSFTGWFHTVAPTAADLSIQWVIPGSATVEWSLLGPASTDAGSEPTTAFQGAIITTGPLTVGGMASSGTLAMPMGTITLDGIAGTCKMQAAQLVASGSSFIRATSWLTVEQIA